MGIETHHRPYEILRGNSRSLNGGANQTASGDVDSPEIVDEEKKKNINKVANCHRNDSKTQGRQHGGKNGYQAAPSTETPMAIAIPIDAKV